MQGEITIRYIVQLKRTKYEFNNKMYFKVLLICVVIALASGIPQPFTGGWETAGSVNPWLPPWAIAKPGPEVNPWFSWWASSQPAPTSINPSAASQVAPNPWSPWATNPWAPQSQPCTAVGADCLDCSTRIVCTKIGSFQQTCSNPTKPYCNLGQCSAIPSATCAPASPVEDDENT